MTKSLMDNEAKRWSYMTDEAMERRLYTITNIDKLQCFIYHAESNCHFRLMDLAKEKLEFLLEM